MPIYMTSVRIDAQRLAEAKTAAVSLARTLQDALWKASTFTDKNLSPEGVAAKRSELAAHFREAASTDLSTLRHNVTSARDYLHKAVAENVTAPIDAGDAIRLEQKWRQAERMLDAGMDLQKVLATADEATTRAILEFGPSWAAATGYRPPTLEEGIGAAFSDADPAAPGAWVTRAAHSRLADVTADPNLAELLRAANAADQQVAVAAPYLEAAQGLVEGRAADLLGAAIASRAAEADAALAAA